MSSHAHTAGSSVHAPMAEPSGFIRKYIFSVDHKVIGIQYFLLALTAVLIGIVLEMLMRFHLCVAERDVLPFAKTAGNMSRSSIWRWCRCTARSWCFSC